MTGQFQEYANFLQLTMQSAQVLRCWQLRGWLLDSVEEPKVLDR